MNSYAYILIQLKNYDEALLYYKKAHADFLSYKIDDLPNRSAARVRRHNQLLVWTVDSDKKVQKAIEQNADNVIFELIDIPNIK